MRVTRLHLLIVLIALAVAGAGMYVAHNSPAPAAPSTVDSKPAETSQDSLVSADHSPKHDLSLEARKKVAAVGEAYATLRRSRGDNAVIATPLKAAKQALAAKQWSQAIRMADLASAAVRASRHNAPDYT